MSQDIFVIVEHQRGVIDDVSFELLGKGRALAGDTGGALVAVLLGAGLQDRVASLGAADRVVMVDDPGLAEFNPETWLGALGAVLEAQTPRLVLMAYTSIGMDLASALSVRQDLPLVSYAAEVAVEDSEVVVTSHMYGGKIYAESVMEGASGLVSVLAGSWPADAGRQDGSPEVVNVAAPASVSEPKVRFLSLVEPEGGDVDITQHEVLVSVGRGIQSEENIEIAEALAKSLGGAVSASRPIIDNKWMAKTRQVGKSGLKVKAKVYLALGISGAPEHIEGMKDSELIIAVNTDETAPIFEHAHYGVTEDLFDIVPLLTEKLS